MSLFIKFMVITNQKPTIHKKAKRKEPKCNTKENHQTTRELRFQATALTCSSAEC